MLFSGSFELNKKSFDYFFTSDINSTTLPLDFRVTVLEENGGSDGNSSVAELEVRVETLEGTAADYETRLTTAETDIKGLRKGKKIMKEIVSQADKSSSYYFSTFSICSLGNNNQ